MKDLTALHAALPDRVGDGLINVRKMMKIGSKFEVSKHCGRSNVNKGKTLMPVTTFAASSKLSFLLLTDFRRLLKLAPAIQTLQECTILGR